jgi:hypothetical protein
MRTFDQNWESELEKETRERERGFQAVPSKSDFLKTKLRE